MVTTQLNSWAAKRALIVQRSPESTFAFISTMKNTGDDI